LAPPLVMFFVLAYALSWAWWLPIVVSGGLPGLLGPLIAAIVVLAVTEGRTGVRRWITTMVSGRASDAGSSPPWRRSPSSGSDLPPSR
jgi:hypothetical protein